MSNGPASGSIDGGRVALAQALAEGGRNLFGATILRLEEVGEVLIACVVGPAASGLAER